MKIIKILCFVFFVLIVIFCPIAVDIFTQQIGCDRVYKAWVNFYGAYIGSILGGIITLYVLFSTIMNENKENIRKEKTEYFDTIIKYVAEYEAKAAKLCASIYQNYNVNEAAKLSNELCKESTELEMYLKIHKQYIGINEFSNVLTVTDKQVDIMYNTLVKNSIDKSSIDEKKINEVCDKVDALIKNTLVELKNETIKYATLNYK